MVCGCILGLLSVAYHPWVNVTLTSDLVSRIIIEPGAYPIFCEVGITYMVCGCIFGWWSVAYHIWVTDLDVDH